MKQTLRSSLLATLLLASTAVAAQSLALNPGLWETTMTQTNPLTGVPETDTSTECLTEKEFDPGKMAQGAQGCSVVSQDVSGNVLTWAMECDMEVGKANAEGRFETDGQTGNGEMSMNMNLGGQSMSIDMSWQARRLGDC